jgi:disulfide bond formation protein DsbB
MTRQDVTSAVSTALAAAAIVLQVLLVLVLVVAVAAIWSRSARRLLVEARDSLLGGELWGAWAVAAIATLGSLFFSEYSHFIPCHLCWLQRIGMYPLSVILLIAAIRRDARGGALYCLPPAIFGACVSIYHVYIEHHPSAQTPGCKVGGTTCATEWIKKVGYITIPVLALTAFLTIITLLAMALSRTSATQSPAT